LEDLYGEFNTVEYPYYTQYVNVFFIDIDSDVESIGEQIVDAKIPYELANFTAGGSFTATQNHMVRGRITRALGSLSVNHLLVCECEFQF